MPADNHSESGEPQSTQAFITTPSARALALVSVAIIIGFLLVAVVDADGNNSSKNNANASTPTTTTTTVVANPNEESNNTTTTAGRPVTGTQKPADVSILVLNGGNISGVAGKVTDALEPLDYDLLSAGDDTSKDKGTIVYYKSGFVNDAKQLETNVLPGILQDLQITQTIKRLSFPDDAPSTWDQSNLATADIVIVVGNKA